MTATTTKAGKPINWENRAKRAERELGMALERCASGECQDDDAARTERDADLIAAIHMLHEQAHGDRPLRSCAHLPCRQLHFTQQEASGPAPTLLPYGDHLVGA